MTPPWASTGDDARPDDVRSLAEQRREARAARELERREDRQRLIDGIVAEPNAATRRTAAIDAMVAQGNFDVRVPGRPPMSLARFTRYLVEQLPELAPGEVTPC